MLVRYINYPVTTLGPGKRVGLWTTGCRHNCFNCIAENIWDFNEKDHREISDIVKELELYLEYTTSITISGGDPFFQDDLLELLKEIKRIGYKDVLIYSGFTYEQIKKDPKKRDCLDYIDVLIDGKYVDKLNDGKPLRGSSNQRIIILNDLVTNNYQEELQKEREFQVILEDGTLAVIGIPPVGANEELERLISKLKNS